MKYCRCNLFLQEVFKPLTVVSYKSETVTRLFGVNFFPLPEASTADCFEKDWLIWIFDFTKRVSSHECSRSA